VQMVLGLLRQDGGAPALSQESTPANKIEPAQYQAQVPQIGGKFQCLLTAVPQEGKGEPQGGKQPEGPAQQLPPRMITAPRLPVRVEALPGLGVIVIRANNQQDLDAALKIMEFIQKLGAGSEMQLQMTVLQHADATGVTNYLNQLFGRITLTPYGTTSSTATP